MDGRTDVARVRFKTGFAGKYPVRGAPVGPGGPCVVFVFVSFAFVCFLGLFWWGASRLLLEGRLSSVCRRCLPVLPGPCLSACLACLSSSSSSFSPFSPACLPFCSLSPMAGRGPIWPPCVVALCRRRGFISQQTGHPTPRGSAPPVPLDIGGWGPALVTEDISSLATDGISSVAT